MTKLVFSTPPTREANFWLARIGVAKKTYLWRLGGSDNVLQNRACVKTMKIVRGSPLEIYGAYEAMCKLMPEVKNLDASNTFAASICKNGIRAREGLQTLKM